MIILIYIWKVSLPHYWHACFSSAGSFLLSINIRNQIFYKSKIINLEIRVPGEEKQERGSEGM